ncbi:MAG: T9SS type A sorting domain-containing protein [Ignavibacteriae bacterium]|nr:T9SS type A sorting domain-containing protein [Ignavibacteriota bacterium]
MIKKYLKPSRMVAAFFAITILFSPFTSFAQYTSLYGPLGQPKDVKDIAVDATGITLYACDKTVLFKSTNGGSNWFATQYEIPSPLVVTCKPDVPAIVVAGVTDMLWYSDNGGNNNWVPSLYSSGMVPLRLSTSPVTNYTNLMYMGRKHLNSVSVYYSGDAGFTWDARPSFNWQTDAYDVVPDPGNQEKVWVGGSDPNNATEGSNPNAPNNNPSIHKRGVWVSFDRGQTWISRSMGDFNVRAVAAYGQTVFAGTASGKIAKSTDGGNSWDSTLRVLSGVSTIKSLRMTSSDTIYAATDNGIYRSTDAGAGWGTYPTGMTDKNLFSYGIARDVEATSFGTTATAVYKSTNAGTSWTNSSTGIGRMSLSSVVSSGSNVWTVSSTSSNASTYNGTTWSNVALGGAESFIGNRISRHPSSGRLFAAGQLNNVAALYQSTDEGVTYPTLYKPSTTTNTKFYGTAVDPLNSNIVYLFGSAKNSTNVRNWYRSSNGGTSWDTTLSVIHSAADTVQDMVVDSTGASGQSQKLLAAIKNGGVYRSTNYGSGWAQVFSSTTADVKSLAMNTTSASVVYAASSIGIHRSFTSGTFWSSIRTGNYKKVVICPGVSTTNNSSIAALTDDGTKIYYSPNAGLTWIDATGSIPTPINNLYGEGTTTGTMYVATGIGTYKIAEPQSPTPNDPATPTKFDVVLDWSEPAGAVAYHIQIAYDTNFTNILDDANNLTSPSYEPLTLINGTTYYWRVAASNIAGESNFSSARSFVVDADSVIQMSMTYNANRNPVFTITTYDPNGGPYKLYRYSCTNGSDCNPHPETTPYQFLGYFSGYTYIDLSVQAKQKQETETIRYYYEARATHFSNKKVVISSDGGGGEAKTVIALDDNLPKETRLYSNFPNPFNPTTEIKYDLHEDAFVSLIVYDVLGREVQTLLNGMESAGYNSVPFNASALPSGVYFYRFSATPVSGQTGSFTDIKKMLLAK